MTFHFIDDGQFGKVPLLMVHGFLSSHRHWEPNLALGEGFRLIRVDLPAHGAAPALEPDDEISPAALIRALEELRAELGIERWCLCGQSFGAGLILRYALDHPGATIAQVFTNANAALGPEWDATRVAGNAERIALIDECGKAGLAQMRFHPRFARRLPAQLRSLLEAEADKVDPAGFRRLLGEALPMLSVRDRIHDTRVPTLLVNGLRERSFQPLRHWIANVLPEIEIVDLEGGHSINLEAPEAFNDAAGTFLRRYSYQTDCARQEHRRDQ